MLNKIVLFIFAILLLSMPRTLQATSSYSKEDVWHRLPKGGDLLDERDRKRFEELIACGEEIYPVLFEIMDETDDDCIISEGLTIMRRAGGDKQVAIDYIKSMIPAYYERKDISTASIFMSVCAALGDIGDEGDIKAVFPLMEHETERVRINAYTAIAKKGDKEAQGILLEKKSVLPEGYEKRRLNEKLATMNVRLGAVAQDVSLIPIRKVEQPIVSSESFPPLESRENVPVVADGTGTETSKPNSQVSNSWKIIIPIVGILIGVLLFFSKHWKKGVAASVAATASSTTRPPSSAAARHLDGGGADDFFDVRGKIFGIRALIAQIGAELLEHDGAFVFQKGANLIHFGEHFAHGFAGPARLPDPGTVRSVPRRGPFWPPAVHGWPVPLHSSERCRGP